MVSVATAVSGGGAEVMKFHVASALSCLAWPCFAGTFETWFFFGTVFLTALACLSYPPFAKLKLGSQ